MNHFIEKNLPYFAIVTVLLYALYNANVKEKAAVKPIPSPTYRKHVKVHKTEHRQEELDRIHSNNYLKEYIVDVINHGSYQFDFPGGEMEGGFASPADAEKIACYVLELSGKKCDSHYEQNAAMFYSSICAGCHGDKGKGLKGTYPDLTKKTLLGITKKEAFLKRMLKKSP